MGCLGDDTIAGYLRRALDDAQRERAESHLRGCGDCRDLVADIAWLSTEAGADAPRREAPEVGVSDTVERYVILRRVGAGSFGTVYAAYDPKLDRRIAVKLVRTDDLGEQRILREAQAMARLSHPNVTAVYDVTVWRERVCIAMEFVDGTDARSWLHAEQRGANEILGVFLGAGQGLKAAHDAGLVHRDFKPANVLIGSSGRVSVTDFGLARIGGPDDRADQRPADAPAGLLDTSMTQAGALVGTPRYMAPEQHRGEVATARSDQFSYCVALCEALAHEHPFAGGSASEGHALPTVLRRVPVALRRTLARGLQADAGERYPSMGPLLDALAPAKRARRRRLMLAGSGAVVLASLPAAWIYDARRREADACTGGRDKVAEVFNERRRAQLRRNFDASSLPYADASWETAERAVQAYLASWEAQYRDACHTTRRGEQSQEVLTARMLCLESARQEVDYVLGELTVRGERAIRSAVASVQGLSDLAACEDAEALLAKVRADPEKRPLVARVAATLARARAAAAAGDAVASFALAQEAVTQARALNHAPSLAEALLQLGRAHAVAGRADRAVEALREAVFEASRGRHDHAAAEAWVDLLFVRGAMQARGEPALEVEHAARAALERVPSRRGLQARHAAALGLVHAHAGRYAVALQAQQEALALLEAQHGEASPQVGVALHRVAEILIELGRADEATQVATRSQEIIARTYGEQHPRIASPLTVLARAACARGQHPRCVELAKRAASTRMATAAAPDAGLLPIMVVHGEGLAGAGRLDAAIETLFAARDAARVTYGARSAWVGLANTALAGALAKADRGDEARSAARTAWEILDAARGPAHPDTAAARKALDSLGAPAEKN